MAVHDVSHELRGEHGKWTRGGAALHRLAKEATAGASHAEAGHKAGDRVKYKTGSIGTVHHIDDKGKVHVVWDKGRGKPVATPAHHLTGATSPAAAEKAVRDVTGAKTDLKTMSPAELKRAREAITYKPGHLNDADHSRLAAIKAEEAKRFRQEKLKEIGHVPPYKPPRQAGSRGGVPAPTTGPDLAHERFINEKLADGKWHDPVTESKDRARATATLSRMEASGKVESQISPASGNKVWRLKTEAKPASGLDPKLLAQVREIEAKEKARVESSNKARFPGGSVTEYKNAGVGVLPPSLSGGATPPKSVSAVERKGLSNILGIPENSITPENVVLLRRQAKAKQSNLRQVRQFGY